MQALIQSYEPFFIGFLIALSVLIFLCLLRACLGPTTADRLVAVNMMGTMVMVIIGLLAILLNEGYLVDISLLYAMLSFLAVILLTKVILGVHKESEVKNGMAEPYDALTVDNTDLKED